MAEVYALKCPDTGIIRYIGMSTVSAASRYREHIHNPLDSIRPWLVSLAPKLPVLSVIESELSNKRATELERKLIQSSENLLNKTHSSKRCIDYDTKIIGDQEWLKSMYSNVNVLLVTIIRDLDHDRNVAK